MYKRVSTNNLTPINQTNYLVWILGKDSESIQKGLDQYQAYRSFVNGSGEKISHIKGYREERDLFFNMAYLQPLEKLQEKFCKCPPSHKYLFIHAICDAAQYACEAGIEAEGLKTAATVLLAENKSILDKGYVAPQKIDSPDTHVFRTLYMLEEDSLVAAPYSPSFGNTLFRLQDKDTLLFSPLFMAHAQGRHFSRIKPSQYTWEGLAEDSLFQGEKGIFPFKSLTNINAIAHYRWLTEKATLSEFQAYTTKIGLSIQQVTDTPENRKAWLQLGSQGYFGALPVAGVSGHLVQSSPIAPGKTDVATHMTPSRVQMPSQDGYGGLDGLLELQEGSAFTDPLGQSGSRPDTLLPSLFADAETHITPQRQGGRLFSDSQLNHEVSDMFDPVDSTDGSDEDNQETRHFSGGPLFSDVDDRMSELILLMRQQNEKLEEQRRENQFLREQVERLYCKIDGLEPLRQASVAVPHFSDTSHTSLPKAEARYSSYVPIKVTGDIWQNYTPKYVVPVATPLSTPVPDKPVEKAYKSPDFHYWYHPLFLDFSKEKKSFEYKVRSFGNKLWWMLTH